MSVRTVILVIWFLLWIEARRRERRATRREVPERAPRGRSEKSRGGPAAPTMRRHAARATIPVVRWLVAG